MNGGCEASSSYCMCIGCEKVPAPLPVLYCDACNTANALYVLEAIAQEAAYINATRRAAVLGLPS